MTTTLRETGVCGRSVPADPRLTISDETVAARRAWLDASRALGAHIDDCLCCLVDWTPDCPEVEAFRRAADDAWAAYEASRS
jgi:hypothetical protein